MPASRRTDERLLSERDPARAGQAFEAFYIRHERLILAYHARRARDPAIAAELTAETFARALESRARFRSQGTGSAARWLYGIASNVGKQYVHTETRQTRTIDALKLEPPALSSEVLAEIEAGASDERVLAALNELPPDQRDAIRSYVLDGESYESIARQQGTSVPAARKRVSRGLRALRRTSEEEQR